MIKAVFFDIDDTLYHFTGTHHIAIDSMEKYLYERLGVKREAFLEALEMAQNKIGKRIGYDTAAFHNRLIRFQNMLEILGKPIHPYASELYELYWGTLILYSVPELGIRELMEWLREKNIHIGCCTDMTAHTQYKKLEKLQLAPLIDIIVTSEEAGADKPDMRIFNLCMEKSQCKPEECLMIGDHPEKDVLGARKAGMHSLCYSKYSRPENLEKECCINSYVTDINYLKSLIIKSK